MELNRDMDKLSDKYDESYARSVVKEGLEEVVPGRRPRRRIEAIVSIEGKGETILNVGCGNGRLLYQFRNRFNKLLGLEFSPVRLNQARLNLDEYDFTVMQGSIENIKQIESDSIDRIISADTIEHVPDVYVVANEMFRILRPSGMLVINTLNIAFIKKRILLMMGRFPSASQANEGLGRNNLFDGGHLHYFTYRSLKLLLERAGFSVTRKTGYGNFGYVHNIFPDVTSVGVQWVARKTERCK